MAADPPGHTFEGAVLVSLSSEENAEIFYTLNGESPAGPKAMRYDQPVLLLESALLTFIAKEGERWSPPVTELYELAADLSPAAQVPRALYADDDALVFSARRGQQQRLEKSVRIYSVGFEDVVLEEVYIGFNPESWSFWEEGAFVLETPVETPAVLRPGESIELVVSYAPTETIRAGLLVVDSNEQRATDGIITIDLMGRIWDW